MADRIAAIGWGTFFVWLGIALLADLGWGFGLLGIGLIALGAQAARWLMRLRLEGFWLLFGVGFVIAGSSRLVGAPLPPIPVVLVLAGLTLVIAAVLDSAPE